MPTRNSSFTARVVFSAMGAAVAGLTCIGSAATAQASELQRSTLVRVSDLDLTRASDIARLDQRVDAAVARVCGDAPALDLHARRSVRRCRVEAAAGAAADINRVMIAAARERQQLAHNRHSPAAR